MVNVSSIFSRVKPRFQFHFPLAPCQQVVLFFFCRVHSLFSLSLLFARDVSKGLPSESFFFFIMPIIMSVIIEYMW